MVFGLRKILIINTKIKAIQDEVPDYIRAPYTFAYIINNFKHHKSIGDYLILRKDQKSDFFLDPHGEKNYKKFLL